jgi:hypothetical protein
MNSPLRNTPLRALDEDEALAAVVGSVQQLFPLVTEHQSRELGRRVLRSLARRGITLAVSRQEDAPEEPD